MEGNSEGEGRKPRMVIERPDYIFEKGRATDRSRKKEPSTNFKIWDSILYWPYTSQVWPLKYGTPICAVMAAGSGAYINSKLRSYMFVSAGQIFSTTTTAFFPALLTGGIHFFTVSNEIVSKKHGCPICLQTRAAAAQVATGVVYPTVMAFAVLLPVLTQMKKSVKMPHITKAPKELLAYVGTLIKPIKSSLFYLSMLQVVVAMGITYLEQDSFLTNVSPYLSVPKYEAGSKAVME